MAKHADLYLTPRTTPEQIETLRQRFAELVGGPLDFSIHLEENLLGGFICVIDGTVYDASLFSKMQNARNWLMSSDHQGAAL